MGLGSEWMEILAGNGRGKDEEFTDPSKMGPVCLLECPVGGNFRIHGDRINGLLGDSLGV